MSLLRGKVGVMKGCICCHGPVDEYDECPICDAPRTPAAKIVKAIIEDCKRHGWFSSGHRSALATMLTTIKEEMTKVVEEELQRQGIVIVRAADLNAGAKAVDDALAKLEKSLADLKEALE